MLVVGSRVTTLRAASMVRAQAFGTPAAVVRMIPFSAPARSALLNVSVMFEETTTPVAASAGTGVRLRAEGDPTTGTCTDSNHVVALKFESLVSPTTRLTESTRLDPFNVH